MVKQEDLLLKEVDLSFYDKYEGRQMKAFFINCLSDLLYKSDWLIIRHNEQKIAETALSLTDSQFSLLSKNRNNIRAKISEMRG